MSWSLFQKEEKMWKAILVSLAFIVSACGGGAEPTDATVEVFKSLGSLQCTGGGTTPAALQSQLTGAGIQVSASSCGSDGNAYPAVCGAPDGFIAIFEVPTAQQSAAQALNFEPLSTVPAATRTACR
jgi:hypothetical protein